MYMHVKWTSKVKLATLALWAFTSETPITWLLKLSCHWSFLNSCCWVKFTRVNRVLQRNKNMASEIFLEEERDLVFSSRALPFYQKGPMWLSSLETCPWPPLLSSNRGPRLTLSTPQSSVLCHCDFFAKTFSTVDFLNLSLPFFFLSFCITDIYISLSTYSVPAYTVRSFPNFEWLHILENLH